MSYYSFNKAISLPVDEIIIGLNNISLLSLNCILIIKCQLRNTCQLISKGGMMITTIIVKINKTLQIKLYAYNYLYY
jgi:hypothetical protein